MIVETDSDGDEAHEHAIIKEALPETKSNDKIAHLQVIVHECRHLLARNRISGKSDPYIKILLLDGRGKPIESAKTTVKKRSLNPQFGGQVFNKFRYSTVFTTLVVEVWNKQFIGKDNFLGQVSYEAEYLIKSDEISGWMQLGPRPDTKETASAEIQGDIRLQIYFAKTEPAPINLKDSAYLFVTVIEGRNIDPWPNNKTKPRPSFNSSNPYYYAKFGNEVVKGHQLARTYHPVWCQHHAFKLDDNTSAGLDSTGVLDIKVMHWDRLSPVFLDKHIGSVSVPLSDFQPSVTVDKWYSLEGGLAHKAWIRLLVKHHDPQKMRRHIMAMFGLFGLVVVLGLVMEVVAVLFFNLKYVGFVGGIAAGMYYNLPGNVWAVYQKSFEYLPFLNPLQKHHLSPETLQPLSGLGLSHYDVLQTQRKREGLADDQLETGYSIERTLSRPYVAHVSTESKTTSVLPLLSGLAGAASLPQTGSFSKLPGLWATTTGSHKDERPAGPQAYTGEHVDIHTVGLDWLPRQLVIPRTIGRFPAWLWLLAVVVAAVAGYVNAIHWLTGLAGGMGVAVVALTREHKVGGKKDEEGPPSLQASLRRLPIPPQSEEVRDR